MHVCWFLNWIHRSSQSRPLLNVNWLIKLKNVVQSLVTHVFLWCLSFDPHLTAHHSNLDVLLRKVTKSLPHTLLMNLPQHYDMYCTQRVALFVKYKSHLKTCTPWFMQDYLLVEYLVITMYCLEGMKHHNTIDMVWSFTLVYEILWCID